MGLLMYDVDQYAHCSVIVIVIMIMLIIMIIMITKIFVKITYDLHVIISCRLTTASHHCSHSRHKFLKQKFDQYHTQTISEAF